MSSDLTTRIFNTAHSHFESLAWEVYQYQYQNVQVYKEFCDALHRTPATISTLTAIPFLPVQLFKSHAVIDQTKAAQKTFESSTTTGTIASQHRVADLRIYKQSYLGAFEQFYGSTEQYIILALLPSYLDRGTSSLLYMADDLIRRSKHPLSGFFNKDLTQLKTAIEAAQLSDRKIFLLGVTYALLDMAEQYPMNLSDAIIMETGGMKGRRAEMTREELHATLTSAFQVSAIHSEYGMTEMLSQGYSAGKGIYKCPPWVRIYSRDPYDPFTYMPAGKTGALNIIDLANIYSCSFLSVSDLGRVYDDGTFEVIGRMDSAEIRGCNLMYEG